MRCGRYMDVPRLERLGLVDLGSGVGGMVC